MSEYATESGEVRRDRDTVLGIWRGNLGRDERMRAKYDWFYLRCPWGEPSVSLLRHAPTNAVAGVATAGPRRFAWRNHPLTAGVLVDLAVVTEHRALGPAMALQRAVLAAGKGRFDFLYGFPNPKAAAVFKRVGYASFGEIVRYVRVLRHARHVAKMLPASIPRSAAIPAGLLLDAMPILRALPSLRHLRTEWTRAVDPRIDVLWSSSAHGDVPMAIRDAAFLRWRFDHAPSARTEYLLVTERADRSRLRAWFACEADDKGALHVRDYWAVDAAAGLDRSVVDALVLAASLRGHESVSFEYTGPPERLIGFLAAGFVPRTRRPIFGAWFTPSDDPRRALVHLTSADEDE